MDVDILFRRKDPETEHCFVLNPIQSFFTSHPGLVANPKREEGRRRETKAW